MWGKSNDARNLLIWPMPYDYWRWPLFDDSENEEVEVVGPAIHYDVSCRIENAPTNQCEQANLVWYYDDSNMVKLGLEQVNKVLCVVMGREEKDRTRTIALASF